MARIDRSARPSKLTSADLARQRASVARWERERRRGRLRERVAMLATWVMVIGGGLALFYLFTGV